MLGFSSIIFNSPFFFFILHDPYARVNFFDAATKDILKLLATPCRKTSLMDQLKRDFPLSSKKKSKKRRNKKPKKPPTKTKRHKKSSKKHNKTRRHEKPKKTNKKSTRRHSEGGDGPTDEPSGP